MNVLLPTQADTDGDGDDDDQPTKDLPAFFRPDVDMPTALQSLGPPASPPTSASLVLSAEAYEASEPYHMVPNLYAYFIKTCMLPIRKVQHDLFNLYFRYVHPMFPVVDEYYFNKLHHRFLGHEELLNPLDFMIYQAILAAGFGHLSDHQLQRTFYKSVHAGQEAQFDLVKERYWSSPTSNPVVLTQICLILTLWSPSPGGAQNNSYWLNRAFGHAVAGDLHKAPYDKSSPPSRHCLLWWCCLVRDRTLALGMRRPYSLHLAPLREYTISDDDFGLEAKSPSFTDLRSKHIEIKIFVWLCKLSDIMASMALFQQWARFARDWSGSSHESDVEELERATAIDSDLNEWQLEFEADMSHHIKGDGTEDVQKSVSILRIISSCLKAVLFQSYLHLSCTDNGPSTSFRIDPLKQIKDAAQAVEASIMSLVENDKSDVLPNWLVTWVGLPVAILHVSHHIHHGKPPDKAITSFFSRFMRRSMGAQKVYICFTRSTKESLQRLCQDNDDEHASASNINDTLSLISAGNLSAISRHSRRKLEAQMLIYVTRSLDSHLELQCE